jgi:hypothetical protein
MKSPRFDRDQRSRLVEEVKLKDRRAEARLAKHGSEPSTGADLPTPRTSLPMTHGGGTRGRPIRASVGRPWMLRAARVLRRRACHAGHDRPGAIRYCPAGQRSTPRQSRSLVPCRRVREMQTYPVEIDPEQLVSWVLAERQAQPSAVKATARRTIEMRELPIRREFHLGDQEREGLNEISTVGHSRNRAA